MCSYVRISDCIFPHSGNGFHTGMLPTVRIPNAMDIIDDDWSTRRLKTLESLI